MAPNLELSIESIDEAATRGPFSGTLAVHVDGELRLSTSRGMAHRAHKVPNTADTRYGIASGSKTFTALAVLQQVERGRVSLEQPVRDLLGKDLPLIDEGITFEHLLSHTSGIGDYLDEEGEWSPDQFILSAPVHTLTTAEAFLPLIDGFPQAFPPGERFAYCNGGYIVLAILLERLTGRSYQDVVDDDILRLTGMSETAFPRLDELPADVAAGYLFDEGDRMNTLHLPVRGNGDGGAILSAAEIHGFWNALHDHELVSRETSGRMVQPRHFVEEEQLHHGLGLWLHPSGRATVMEGYDSGVSFRSTHLPEARTTVSVLGNTSEGAWPLIGAVAEAVDAALAGQ